MGALALLSVWLGAAPVCAAAEDCGVKLSMSGRFDRSAPADLDPSIDLRGPAKVVLSDAALKLLNDRWQAAVRDALAGLGLTEREEAERLFSLEVCVGRGEPGGRREGGHVLRATVRALRPESGVVGVARQAVAVPPKLAWQPVALRTAVREVIRRAFADLRERSGEAKAGRALAVAVQINGLDAQGRDAVRDRLLPCLRRLFGASASDGSARESGGYLEARFFYRPAPDEPRESLAQQVARVRRAVSAGPEAECPLSELPLPRVTPRVIPDTFNRGVLISLSGR